MNNVLPFFNPFNNFYNINNEEYEKLINKLERLEKNINILDAKIKELEKKNNSDDYAIEESTDMYII